MIHRLLVIAAALATPLAPAAAQSLAQTHEKIWMPAGKTVPLYREIKRDSCRAPAAHHPAGKIRHQGAQAAACSDVAARDARPAGGGRGAQ